MPGPGNPEGLRILDATGEGRREWLALWRAWPDREVLAHPDYVRLFARPCDRAVCAVLGDPAGAILLPLVLRPLAAEPWAPAGEATWDATSPYGYGGPFAWGAAAADAEPFWRGLAAWAARERLVCTFLRLSLFPRERPAGPAEARVSRPNVVLDLGGGIDAVWRGYAKKVRQNVLAARRALLQVEVDEAAERLGDFLEVYLETMRRRGAAEAYFFPRHFFEAIAADLRGQCALFHAVARGEVVASELVLVSERRLYSFLGGTRAAAFGLRPGELLKHAIAEWGAARGKRELVLGGGFEPRDGILRFKLALAPRGEVPYEVACLAHDEEALRRLLAARRAFEGRRRADWEPRPGHFPAYRG